MLQVVQEQLCAVTDFTTAMARSHMVFSSVKEMQQLNLESGV